MTEFLDVTGRRIPYAMNGIGPMVVLSHGIGDRRPAYRFLAPIPTQAGYGVARADLRRYGDSSMGWASINQADLARATRDPHHPQGARCEYQCHRRRRRRLQRRVRGDPRQGRSRAVALRS